MSDHGWDHHDPYDHDPFHHDAYDDLPGHDDDAGLPVHDAHHDTDPAPPYEPPGYEPPGDDVPHHDTVQEYPHHHDDPAATADTGDPHGMGPVGADPDAVDPGETVSVFPPVVDVGALPEPVDGFPWIDTGSLGPAHPAAEPAEPVDPAGLAEYAAADLPPGADPWATLRADDDPATSALARWWGEHH